MNHDETLQNVKRILRDGGLGAGTKVSRIHEATQTSSDVPERAPEQQRPNLQEPDASGTKAEPESKLPWRQSSSS